MSALTTTANLVDYASLEEGAITATLEREDLDALAGGPTHKLWFELLREGETEPLRMTVELTDADVAALVAGAPGEEVILAFDRQELGGLLEEPDVEAHGLRGALAVSLAVVGTTIGAPAALAATPQSLETASVSPAVTSQQVGSAATTQVSSQIVRQQLARGASAKSQQASAYKFAQLSILRAGAVR